MKIPLSPLKYGIISGSAFFGTVAILSLVYAAIGTSWTSPNTLEVGAGSGLTASSWNAMLANFNNLDARSVPTGAVMAFYGSSCPNEWSPANGTINGVKKTDGTLGTLDLRGEFIRGLDDGRGVNSGRGVGTFESGTLMPYIYVHRQTATSGLLVSPPVSSYPGDNVGIMPQYSDSTVPATIGTYFSTALTPNGGFNSSYYSARPRNVALLYCVKN